VVLLSAGIGGDASSGDAARAGGGPLTRQVLWLHAARDRQYHPFAAKSAGSCSRSRTVAAMFATAGRARATRWVRISMLRSPVAIDFRSDPIPRRMRMSTSAGDSLHGGHERAALNLGRIADRIHVELFSGSES